MIKKIGFWLLYFGWMWFLLIPSEEIKLFVLMCLAPAWSVICLAYFNIGGKF